MTTRFCEECPYRGPGKPERKRISFAGWCFRGFVLVTILAIIGALAGVPGGA